LIRVAAACCICFSAYVKKEFSDGQSYREEACSEETNGFHSKRPAYQIDYQTVAQEWP